MPLDPTAPVVAFDLDMTLVDSAAGIVATQVRVAAELGVELDPEELRAQVGLPLALVYERLPARLVPDAIARYRALYPVTGVPPTTALPGARESLAAVRARGGRAVVVSAKIPSAVHAVLEHVGLRVDAVSGDLFAAGKGVALREHGAAVMVGDHPGDMAGARAGGAYALGVATGPHDAGALREAGAAEVLASLEEFPAWLDDWLPLWRTTALEPGAADDALAG